VTAFTTEVHRDEVGSLTALLAASDEQPPAVKGITRKQVASLRASLKNLP
jgi:hypothetical protein